MRPLPASLRAWLDEAIGPGERVVATVPLPGATSSDLSCLTVATRRGATRRLVLRWYPDDRVLGSEPEAVAREAAALEALEGSGVPAPRLVAATSPGKIGPGAVLMTHVPGGPLFQLPDGAAVREIMDAIHGVDPTALAGYRYRGYHEDAKFRQPTWWRDPPVWDRAIRQSRTARPDGPGVFLHRDFHPGNLLWTNGYLSGVVDWVNACVGPAGVDAAHCRLNLAVLWGPEEADRLLPGDPAWDIEAALGSFDWDLTRDPGEWPGAMPRSLAELGAPLVDVPTARARLEAFVAQALARLR